MYKVPILFEYQSPSKGAYYFPLNSNDSLRNVNGKLDSITNSWYSEVLFNMKEPILHGADSANHSVFRFTYIATWQEPKCYRIERLDSLVTITRKVIGAHDGKVYGNLTIHESKALTLKEWNQFQKALNKISFWELETHGIWGKDGAQWILEGVEKNKYHVVNRWSPDHYGPKKYAKTCWLLKELFDQ